MKPTYRIKDWNDHFETAESRKLKSTRWVPMPTKHDGKSYRRITQHANAAEIFCAWNLIVQVASKTPVRGVLADADGPLDAEDLAVKTGFSASIFTLALEFLSTPAIGWMQTESQQRKPRAARIRQTSSGLRDVPPESPGIRQNPSPEGKGIEGNGKEEDMCSKAAPVDLVFCFWKEHFGHPNAKLDHKRESAIKARLKAGYSVDDLMAAIRGCKLTPYNMGENPERRIYDDIELICRDASHTERFMSMANGQAGPVPVQTIRERMAAR